MTRRQHVDVPAPALGGAGAVIAYGHWGRPFLVFPSEQGRAWDFENNGMVDAVRPLLDAGRPAVDEQDERVLPRPHHDNLAVGEERVGVAHSRTSSRPRMGPGVDLPDALSGEVSVKLGGPDAGMTQKFLDDSQVGATGE